MPTEPGNAARMSRCSWGGLGAPPPGKARTSAKSWPSALAAAPRYTWWKTVPDPARVTPSRSSTSTTTSGTNASKHRLAQPVWRLVTNQVMPPM